MARSTSTTTGPGHGGPAIVGNVYLEGTWSEVYSDVTLDEAGLKKLFKQFAGTIPLAGHGAATSLVSLIETTLGRTEALQRAERS